MDLGDVFENLWREFVAWIRDLFGGAPSFTGLPQSLQETAVMCYKDKGYVKSVARRVAKSDVYDSLQFVVGLDNKSSRTKRPFIAAGCDEKGNLSKTIKRNWSAAHGEDCPCIPWLAFGWGQSNGYKPPMLGSGYSDDAMTALLRLLGQIDKRYAPQYVGLGWEDQDNTADFWLEFCKRARKQGYRGRFMINCIQRGQGRMMQLRSELWEQGCELWQSDINHWRDIVSKTADRDGWNGDGAQDADSYGIRNIHDRAKEKGKGFAVLDPNVSRGGKVGDKYFP